MLSHGKRRESGPDGRDSTTDNASAYDGRGARMVGGGWIVVRKHRGAKVNRSALGDDQWSADERSIRPARRAIGRYRPDRWSRCAATSGRAPTPCSHSRRGAPAAITRPGAVRVAQLRSVA